MIARILLFASAAAALGAGPASSLLVLNGTTDTPVGSSLSVGTAAPGDTLQTRFHVRNTGSRSGRSHARASRAKGSPSHPLLPPPYILAPYVGLASEAEFDVDFSPRSSAPSSAFLDVNSISITLLAGKLGRGGRLTLSGSQTPLTAGAVVNFGSVAIGDSPNAKLRSVEFGQHQLHGKRRHRLRRRVQRTHRPDLPTSNRPRTIGRRFRSRSRRNRARLTKARSRWTVARSL